MSTDGIEDVFITDGSLDGDVFLYFVRKQLLPILQPFDCNDGQCAIHHVDSVVARINSVGALVRFLPSYSPDMNPIESVFSEVS